MISKRILIVEDEQIIALDLRKILQNLGYEVVAILPTGEEAIANIIGLNPDLVMMDIHLGGGVNGIEAANELHKLLDVPVIFLTASGDPATLARAKISAPFGYLLKPFDKHILHATIEIALERRSLERKLRENEEQYRQNAILLKAVIENSNARIWSIDRDYNLLACNSAFEEKVASDTGRILQKGDSVLLEAIFPATLEEFKGYYLRALAGEHLAVEKKITQNNENRFSEYLFNPLIGEAGNVNGVTVLERDITQKKRDAEAIQRRFIQLTLINEIGREIASSLKLDSILSKAAQLIQEQFGYHHVGLFLLDAEQGVLSLQAKAGSYVRLLPAKHQLTIGQGMVGWCGQHGERVLANDVSSETRYVNLYPDRIPTRSELCVPLRIGKDILGVLDVQSPLLDAFGKEDILVIETLADQIAVAIENARLYEQVRRDAETRATLLHEVNHRVSNNLAALIGVIGLEQTRATRSGTEAYSNFLNEIGNRVQGLAAVHRLFSMANWSPLPAHALVEQIISGPLKLVPVGKWVKVNVTPTEIVVNPRQANSLALLVNELATNTLKHALTDRDSVAISISFRLGSDGYASLVYRDDGAGFPKNVMRWQDINTGMDLIRTLSRIDLAGDVILSNDHGAVTTIRFKYPTTVRS